MKCSSKPATCGFILVRPDSPAQLKHQRCSYALRAALMGHGAGGSASAAGALAAAAALPRRAGL